MRVIFLICFEQKQKNKLGRFDKPVRNPNDGELLVDLSVDEDEDVLVVREVSILWYEQLQKIEHMFLLRSLKCKVEYFNTDIVVTYKSANRVPYFSM